MKSIHYICCACELEKDHSKHNWSGRGRFFEKKMLLKRKFKKYFLPTIIAISLHFYMAPYYRCCNIQSSVALTELNSWQTLFHSHYHHEVRHFSIGVCCTHFTCYLRRTLQQPMGVSGSTLATHLLATSASEPMPAAPRVPRRSPVQVLARPNVA